MKYEYWKSSNDGQWHWHLKAANGEKIAYGEGYSSKEGCLHAIALVQSSSSAPLEER